MNTILVALILLVVIAFEVEHFLQVRKLKKKLEKVLKQGGYHFTEFI